MPQDPKANSPSTLSITEQNDLDEFMQVATLSSQEFRAERQSSAFINNGMNGGGKNGSTIEMEDETTVSITPQELNSLEKWICIPRRPNWKVGLTANELHVLENESFLEWRRNLAKLENSNKFILTPFERNLEIWRQLWRVIEASQVIIQIIDARNPMLFYCEDLKQYVEEVDPKKETLLILNKADFLTEKQRILYSEYFDKKGISHVFYSAKTSMEIVEKEKERKERELEHFNLIQALKNNDTNELDEIKEYIPEEEYIEPSYGANDPSYTLLGRVALLEYLNIRAKGSKMAMVGYPNVGKSSTINSLAGDKKVAVASTPGKTKHFQTVKLSNGVVLLDCPGLVFPNRALSKADLVLNGILPIDQMREWNSAVTLLVNNIPINILERSYGIQLEHITKGMDGRPLDASDLLSAFARARGFCTSFFGNPDESRAARIILKDYVAGKILFCYPPDSIDAVEFNKPTWDKMMETLIFKNPNFARALSTSEVNPLHLLDDETPGFAAIPAIKTAGTSNTKKHFKKNKKVNRRTAF